MNLSDLIDFPPLTANVSTAGGAALTEKMLTDFAEKVFASRDDPSCGTAERPHMLSSGAFRGGWAMCHHCLAAVWLEEK